MRISILTVLLVTIIAFFSYASPIDNGADYVPPSSLLSAVADAGPDTTLTCVVNTVTLEGMNTSLGSEFTYEWTDKNGNIIGTDPDVYVFEPGEFILSVTNNTTSFVDMDTTIVSEDFAFLDFQIIDPDNLTCVTSSVLIDLVLDNPNAVADFEWSGPSGVISTEEDLVAFESGLYAVIVTNVENGCSSEESVVVFDNTSFPIAITNVQNILSCDQPLVLIEGDTNVPNATFEWTNDAGVVIANSQSVEVDQAGIYALTVTDPNNGCSGTSSVEVTSNQEGGETINVPTITSSATSVTLDAEEFVNPSPGSTFEWTTAAGVVFSVSPQVEIVEEGVYVCTITNATNGCVIAIIIYNVDFFTNEVADAGPDQTLTCINTTVTLGGPNTPIATDITYQWLDAAQNVIGNQFNVLVDLPGVYTLTVTNIVTGESASDEVSVFIDVDIPEVAISSPGTLTCENNMEMLFGASTTPNVNYLWTSADGNIISDQPTAVVDQQGTYTLTVTDNNNGCSAESSVSVESDQTQETINVPTISTSEPSITLNATDFIDLSLSPWEFSWTAQNGNPLGFDSTLDVNQTGIYTCIATNAINGCPTTIIYTVNFMTVLVADAGPDQTLNCNINAVTLGGPNTTFGPNISYNWTDAFGNQISSDFQTDVFQAGQYTLTVNDVSTGEMAVDIVIVTEDTQEPFLFISPTPTITCFTPTATLVASSSNVDPAFASYTWESFGGSILTDPNQASIIVDEGGAYSVTLTNLENGCSTEEVVDVQVNQENRTQVVPTISSPTPTFTIDPSNFIQDPNCTFAWTMQAGLTVTNFPLAEISEEGTYTFVKTDPATGCTTSYIYTVQFVSGSVADAGPDVEITCNNPNATIGSNNTSVGPNFIYEWTGPNGNAIGTTPFIKVTAPGVYTLSVFNTTDNTFVTDMVTVLIDGVVPSINIPTPGVLDCNNTVVTIQGFSSIGVNVTFQWTANFGNIISPSNQANIDVDEPGIYSLEVTNLINGCSSILAVEVIENIDGGSFDIEPIQSSTYPITIVADDFPTNLNLDLAWTPSTGLTPIDNTTAEISQPGQYTFVATNTETGCDYNYVYTVYDNVLADAGEAQSLTCLVNSVTLGGTNTSSGPSIEYEWQNENENQIATTAFVDVSEAGLFTLIVTDNMTGETIQDQVLVSEDFEEPLFTITSPAPLTFAEPLTLLDANLFSPDAAVALFDWTTPDGNTISTQDIEVDIAGLYVLTVTNTVNGCMSSSEVAVVQNFDSETIPLEFIVASSFPITLDPTAIVEDTSGIIHTPYPLERSDNFEFKWIEREGLVVTDFPIAEVSQAGLYAFLRREISTGFVTRYEYDIRTGADTPIADAGEIEINCFTPESFTLGGPNTSCGLEFTYIWTDENGTAISIEKNPVVTELDTYTLTVTNTNTGEQSSSTVVFVENRDIPEFSTTSSSATISCLTPEVTLEVSIISPTENVSVLWTGPGILSDPNSEDIVVNQAGLYEVLITNLENGCATNSAIQITEEDLGPTITVDVENVSCNGANDGMINLAASGGSGTFAFILPDSISNTNLSPGTYGVSVVDTNGCIDSTTFMVVEPAALEVEFVINASNQLEAVVTGGIGGYTYDWNVEADSSIIDNPINGTEYILTVTDANGCALTETFVFVIDAVFTPVAKEISVSPNPTDGLLHLDLDAQSISQVSQLQIFDLKGVSMKLYKPLLSSSRITLDLSDLQAGMYILHVLMDGELFYQKVIVQ